MLKKSHTTVILCIPLLLGCVTGCSYAEIIKPDSERVVPEDYIPFAEEGKHWTYCTYSDEVYQYLVSGDTTIANVQYKKMFIREDEHYGDSLYHYIGAVRDTLMKVLFVDVAGHDERMIYDFGMDYMDMMRWHGETLICNGNDTITIEGQQRIVVYISSSSQKIDGYWVVGIGNISNYDPVMRRYSFLKRCDENEGCCYDYQKNIFQ